MSEAAIPPIVSDERQPRPTLGRVADARGDTPLWGDSALSRLERAIAWLTNRAGAGLSESANPFARAGAVPNTAFLIALVTGILLLFWYKASVNQAHASLEGLALLPQLIRSLHRYSSDVAMIFAIFHGVQTLAARKLGGARWLAWLSGLFLLAVLWFDGWTGYWLVWDERGRQVALASAKLMDLFPIFPDPLSRSFLTDETVNSLLFFIVFFIHMLIPVGFGLFIWAQIMRVNRSKLFTGRVLTAWLLGSLVVLSLFSPALSVEPASMARLPGNLSGDWWFLGPLTIIERLGDGTIWLVFSAATVVLFVAPWLAPRRPVSKTVIDAEKCNGCTQCFKDCPFNAITLHEIAPTGRESAFFAQVDPVRCVGCGICVGSCGDAATLDSEESVCVAFVCGASAGGTLGVDSEGGCEALPGYRVIAVMCTGWVQMLTVERALRRGAAGVLIVSCGQGPTCREGCDWTEERLQGVREPGLRHDKVDTARIRHVRIGAGGAAAVAREAAGFRRELAGLGTEGQSAAEREPLKAGRAARFKTPIKATLLATSVTLLTWLPSDLSLLRPAVEGSQLVVSFKHAGQPKSGGGLTDDSNVLPHMRRPRTTERGRVPVRMLVRLDNQLVSEETYDPTGLFDDGASIAIAEFSVSPGSHTVSIQLADTDSTGYWNYRFEEELTFAASERRVVLFEETHGFTAF
ncbi:MAG: coenzyme F420-reducing hydrogenase delta subunit/Pyruvate [Rhodothermales bacterium]|jgi:coenzyme F420-reducing hydrogenase delta subunit/Pyruvate/2-oxoacid:ferredoxin oxidoreductase delta subunit